MGWKAPLETIPSKPPAAGDTAGSGMSAERENPGDPQAAALVPCHLCKAVLPHAEVQLLFCVTAIAPHPADGHR